MANLFRKINTLVRAGIDSLIEDGIQLARPRSEDRPLDPADPRVNREIAQLRQQIDDALAYEDDLQMQIDALMQDASDLDVQADNALIQDRPDEARRVLDQLKRVRQQVAMLEANMARHRQQTATLMDRVNLLEGLVAEARAQQSTSQPAEQGRPRVVHVPLSTEDLSPVDGPEISPEPVPDEDVESPQPPIEDDNLAARRDRLSRRDPNSQE